MGHTHYPFVKKIGKTIIINPGSVGQPRDEGGNSSWALVDFNTGEAVMRRTRFLVDELIKEININDPEISYLKEVLIRKSSYEKNKK